MSEKEQPEAGAGSTVPHTRAGTIGSIGSFGAKAACLIAAEIALPFLVSLPCHAETKISEAEPAPRVAKGVQPYELVRILETLHDRIARGDVEARAHVPKLLGRTAAAILAADPATWDDPRNLRAVIVYAASGGQPRAARAVATLGVAQGETKDLLEGILAYVEGRDAEARRALLPIEAMNLPGSLAGHIAMIQANLLARDEPETAMRLLARARVLAPGTLVEEAALRKQIFLADRLDDVDDFASLSGQYLRRFGKSTYAENFRRAFEAGIMRLGLTSDRARFAKVEAALEVLDSNEALGLLLATARAGLLAGTVEQARPAIEKAVALAGPGTAEAARATLYAAAMRVLTGDIDVGLAELGASETSAMTNPDKELVEAVRAVASQIRAEPPRRQPAGTAPDPGENGPPASTERPASLSAAATIGHAESALGEIENLLERNGL